MGNDDTMPPLLAALRPDDVGTLLTLEEAAAILGYAGYSRLRQAATADPPTLETVIRGARHRFVTPRALHAYYARGRRGNYRRGVSRDHGRLVLATG